VKYIRKQACEHFNLDSTNPWPLKGRKLVDIGCGGGILSEALARLGADVTGVDPGEENIQAATAHATLDTDTQNIQYTCSTAEEMVKNGAKFDIVCCLEVVEHVNDVPTFVQSLSELVQVIQFVFVYKIFN